MEQTSKQKRWAIPFFTIWTGQAFSLLGSSVAGFALVWWLTKTTGSATVLATATLVAMLPGILLGPLAGALVDRWNRRLVMIVADSFVALVSAWLAYLFWVGAMRPWHVYVISLARAVGGCFHWPAMQASVSLMVPGKHLSRVAGFNQTLHGAMNIVAPPMGALLLSLLPLHGIMGIDVVTASLAILSLVVVFIPQPERTVVSERGLPSVWQDVRAGFRYVRGWRGLTLLLVMAAIINFMIYPGFSLLPLLVSEHFHGQALQLGWMNSAWGIGIVLGGLILGVWGGFRRRMFTSLAGVAGMGLGFTLIGLAPGWTFVLALGATFFAGLMNPIANGPIHAMLQTLVAPEMQGRVFTLIGSATQAAAPLGLAVAGPLADIVGVKVWFVLGGVACLLIGVGGFFLPPIVHLEDGHRAPAEATEAAATGGPG